MRNEIPLSYLQQPEVTKNQFTNFTQRPKTAESLQSTMSPYFMGGASITSNKLFLVFTGKNTEHSVEDYLNAVRANMIFNIGPESINLQQNWTHRPTALIQTTSMGQLKFGLQF